MVKRKAIKREQVVIKIKFYKKKKSKEHNIIHTRTIISSKFIGMYCYVVRMLSCRYLLGMT